MRGRAWLIMTVFLIGMVPGAQADLSTENQTLNLVCSNESCSLSQDSVGDSVLSEEERDANPLPPVPVTLEFPMMPDQTSLSLHGSHHSSEFLDPMAKETGDIPSR